MQRKDTDDPGAEDDGAAGRALDRAGNGQPARDADGGQQHGTLGAVKNRVGIGVSVVLGRVVRRGHVVVVAHA